MEPKTNPENKPAATEGQTGNPNGNTQPKKQHMLSQRWRAVSINNQLIVIFSGLTMVATLLYSIFAGWQLYEIHSSSKDTHILAEQANLQAAAAKATADAAQTAANASNDANRLTEESLRARIERRNTQFDRPVAIGDNIRITSVFANVGHSPAMQIQFRMNVKRWRGMPAGPMPVRFDKPGGSLQPGETDTANMVDPEPATQEFLDGLPATFGEDSKELTAYFFGRFEYMTLGKQHHTEYCFFLVQAEIPKFAPKPQALESRYTPRECPKWHDAN